MQGRIQYPGEPSLATPTPSESDIPLTHSLRTVAKILDIPLLDHVIIGSPSTAYPEGWFSFKAAGYL